MEKIRKYWREGLIVFLFLQTQLQGYNFNNRLLDLQVQDIRMEQDIDLLERTASNYHRNNESNLWYWVNLHHDFLKEKFP